MYTKKLQKISALLAVAIIILLAQCKGKQEKKVEVDPAFTSRISAFTSGTISVGSSVHIRLTESYKNTIEINTPVGQELFSFSPRIKGHAYWVDNRTIEFRPDEKLKSGQTYNVKFYLSKILDVPNNLKTFEFSFETIKQTFAVNVEGFITLDNNDLTWNRIRGSVLTADITDADALRRILTAEENKTKLPVTWTMGEDERAFNFYIDSVKRNDNEQKVIITWDGKPIDVEEKGSKEVSIPSLKNFTLLDTKIFQQPEQYVLLTFSDPIKKSQDLTGLIRLENSTSLNFAVDGNQVKAYPAVRQSGTLKLFVEHGIRNSMSYKLPESHTTEITFEAVKPGVRINSKGVILPNSKGLIFPFEAVNLKAIDVRIIKIFENNVAQFLQVNQLEGDYQLKRAGRLIHKETVKLGTGKPVDFGKWNTFYLDLANFIQPDPGAIYRVELGFKKNYSLYPCGEDTNPKADDLLIDEEEEKDDYENEIGYWETNDDYYESYYPDDYNWRDRDNPCTNSYYGKWRSVARNILASDLGIIAKKGENNTMRFAVTNLITTEPMANVEIDIYDYQQQLIASANTDNDGFCEIRPERQPFLLIAKSDKQRGYLRLDDGSSLSLSKFDVSGNVVQKGIKGFIYGERGVWRPGDTLFLTFMLEDKENLLPENHPVIFELYNPQGQLITRLVKTSSVNGFYSFNTATSPDAPTGNWNAKIKVGGTQFNKTLKIETVKPNRLKIKLDFGKEKLSIADASVNANMEVTWLHGAIAKNLDAKVSMTLTPASTKFTKYPNYYFTDPSRNFSSEEKQIFDGSTNDQGKASFSLRMEPQQEAPGMLTAHFITRVFEKSGDFSVDRFSIPYSPYKYYVGIKPPRPSNGSYALVTDTLHTVDVVTVNPDGSPVSRSNLEVKIYKVDWRWWWETSYDNIASYTSGTSRSLVYSTSLSTNNNGQGQFRFKIKYPDWGRYLIRVYDPASGHAAGTTVYVDWPSWVGRDKRENPGGATMLTFNADKEKYNVGETANITIPTSGKGRALVSIESGSKIVNAYWVETVEKETNFSFKITPEMAPNVYVNVTYIQPHKNTVNDLPIRLYGIIPLMVVDPGTILKPRLNMPEILEPESEVTIKVNEENNKEMTYTLAIVDEGLLDLTHFKTPEPWNVFYAREALGVKTWDVFDEVIGAYGGNLEQILSVGGDDESAAGNQPKKANRFKPMVLFLGPYTLAKGKTNSHVVKIPRYVGSVRTMIIAGNKGEYGSSEKTTPVRKPLMVLATLPRVLGPGETVKLPVTVFAMEKNINQVKVKIEPNNLLIPQDETSKTIQFGETGDQIVNFNLAVASRLGIGKVKVTATSGSQKAEYDIELDVRNPNPPVTTYYDAVVEPGKNWNVNFDLPGMPGTNEGVLELSGIPPIDFGRRLKYLMEYPHGCIEQTTSRAFPQLYLGDVMKLNTDEKNRTELNVKEAINSIRKFMLSGGGIGYWPNSAEADDWATSYAGHFMLEAEAKGYAIPPGFIQNWKKYQRRMARQWSTRSGKYKWERYYQGDLEQAYRLYTLALAKEPEIGAMNRLRETKDLSIQAKWRLAAAYALAGQPEIAKDITNGESTEIQDYSGFYSSYGSASRDMAMILETLTLLNEREKGISLARKLSDQLTSSRWMSTQTTAYCLLAMSKFAGEQGTSKELNFAYSFNGAKTVNGVTTNPVSEIQLKLDKKSTAGKLSLDNHGSGILFARLTFIGTPETDSETDTQNNLNMYVSYKDMNGNSIDVTRLEQGTDFMAIVTITNTSATKEYYRDMALTQIFPSGWEIHNTRMDDFKSTHEINTPTYQDIRDDRVYTYFNIPGTVSSGNNPKSFVILLNASYLGKFYLPAVYCEAMYNNRINARKAGKWVEVVKPGN